MNTASAIFLALFGGIFFLAGLAVIISSLGDAEQFERGDAWAGAAMGAVFAAAGAGIIWLGMYSRAQARRLAEAQRQYPSQPWRWGNAWRSPRIEHHAGGAAVGLWVFALLWNGIAFSAGFAGWEEMTARVSEEPAMLLFLLFPVIGILVLIGAIRATMQWKRFGTSALVLRRLPVALGADLEAQLELPNDVRDAEEVTVTLRCTRTTRSGKNTTTTILWHDERRHPRSSMGSGPAGPTLAVRFRVPGDQPETTVGAGYPSVAWELSAAAEVAGVDFSSSYRLPVFRTDETPEPGQQRSPDHATADHERPSGVVRRTIARERAADGSAVWHFAPFRARKAAMFMLGFTAAWSVVVYAIATADVPGLILALFAFFEVLLLLGLVDVMLTRVVVTADAQGFSIQSGPIVPINHRRIAKEDVGSFQISLGMSVGSRSFHTIEMITQQGKKVTVGKHLASRGEAEEIVREMEEEMRRG